MQIICIYSGVSPFEQKLDYVFNVFKNTLNEIDVKVNTLDITKLEIGYYNGIKQPIIENIFSHIKKAQGVIFACTAQRFAINGAMQVFLEHLDYNLYKDVLKDKHCMSIITSSDNSEYMAGNYMNTIIEFLGGINVNSMFIGKDYLTNIEISNDTTEIIEKYAEDYYRMVKQNRKFFTSNPFKNPNVRMQKPAFNFNVQNDEISIENLIKQDDKPIKSLTGNQVANLYKKEIDNNIERQANNTNYNNVPKNNINEILKHYKSQQESNVSNVNNNINADNGILQSNNQYLNQNQNNQFNNSQFNNSQFNNQIDNNNIAPQEDIDHIAKLLGQKYEEENNIKRQLSEYVKYNNNKSNDISPSISTLKQKTQSLHHYFQPQLAGDINIVMQVSISGKENFNGFIVIKNGECNYSEGTFPSADVTIISDSIVWEEVLSGKCTLQKAFMLGRLKVKGNFVIISKFEQFFKVI
ncbi:SCP2 sterol-binding domain-containing protein [uncultured Tyzzerella sp.]|uniref:SCP2 sterol-binding domain-containing protein n=1 Tax=uncultured Tyzzerella sp. TaxID=2321398 RepID=UPI0029438775|nr:SCP2 sterol-binding domain-containing protein [uncultured Tyzzerella sp.]